MEFSQFADGYVENLFGHGWQFPGSDRGFGIGLNKMNEATSLTISILDNGIFESAIVSPRQCMKRFNSKVWTTFLIFNQLEVVGNEDRLILINPFFAPTILNEEAKFARGIAFNMLRELLQNIEYSRRIDYFKLHELDCLQEGAQRRVNDLHQKGRGCDEIAVREKYIIETGQQGIMALREFFEDYFTGTTILTCKANHAYQLSLKHDVVFIRETARALR